MLETSQTNSLPSPAVKQERITNWINTKIGSKELSLFAQFVKSQIGNKDGELQKLNETKEIIAYIAKISSQRVIPTGFSLTALVTQFISWHSKGGAGVKRLGTAADTVPDAPVRLVEEETVNTSTADAGGITLQKIGASLDSDRTFTPTAINDILNKLTEQGEGKLDIMRTMLKHYFGLWASGDKTGIVNFSNTMKKSVVKAAGDFVDYIEEARDLDPEGNTVVLENLHKVLDKNKLRDSMSPEDKAHEDLFLTCLIDHANNPDTASENSDTYWKDIVMEMLAEDLLNSPIFAERQELNIVKSFQNRVANLVKPPPRRGRPAKNK